MKSGGIKRFASFPLPAPRFPLPAHFVQIGPIGIFPLRVLIGISYDSPTFGIPRAFLDGIRAANLARLQLECTTFLLLNRKDQNWQTAQSQISLTKQSQYLMERRNENPGMD
jgi:hypothetical protein